MNTGRWLHWGKRGFLGLSLIGIILTAVTDDGKKPTKPASEIVEHASKVSIVYLGSIGRHNTEAVLPGSRIEFERMAQTTPQQRKDVAVNNVFAATSWYVPPPPPPPVKPLPPPKPTAPPMPFTFLGTYEGGKGTVIMLVKADRVYTVAVGDVIESTYRIDSMEHGMVEMTYLPLNIRQSISTGSPS